jgi:hypothetical protein
MDESNTPENISQFIKEINNLKETLNFQYNTNLTSTSTQSAYYEGKGNCYKKHADSTPFHSTNRRLTAILYLNKEQKGGNIKLYRKESSFKHEISYLGEENEIEVEPIFNRMIIFASDLYHEVLPSYSDRFLILIKFRYALSTFIYGNEQIHEKISLKSIFVSICSYRDTECQYTIKDLFEKSQYPNR